MTQSDPGFDALRLRSWYPNVLVADIIRNLWRDLRYLGRCGRSRKRVFGKYDHEFRTERPDYDLCRINSRIDHYPPKRLSNTDALRLTLTGVKRRDCPLVFWGTFGAFLRLRVSKCDPFTRQETKDVMLALEAACFDRLPAFPDNLGRYNCHLAEALFLDAVWAGKELRGERLEIAAIEKYASRFTLLLGEVDPLWAPGRSISLRALRDEAHQGMSVFPLSEGELYFAITHAMARVARITPRPMREYDCRVRALLRRSFQFSLSAWRLTRSQRILDLNSVALGRKNVRKPEEWWLNEGMRLAAASKGALNVGNFLLAGCLSHLLLRAVPTDHCLLPLYTRLADQMSSLIRQVGYEVDSRFRTDDSNRRGKKVIRKRRIAVDPWELFIDNDQRTNSRWKIILRAYHMWKEVFPALYEGVPADPDWKEYDPRFLLGTIAFGAELPSFRPQYILRPAFNLCLRYGCISWAARLLICMSVSARDLVNFAHSIKRCLQAMPYGWDMDEQVDRLNILRRAWSHYRGRPLQVWEALGLHEVLMGRVLAILKSQPPASSRLLAEKMYGLASAAKIRQVARSGKDVPRRGAGTVDKRFFNRFLRDHEKRSSLGPLVCFSIISSKPGWWSILATGGEGRWRHQSIYLPGLSCTASRLERNSHWWHKMDEHGNVYLIPWGPEFMMLADTLARIGASLAPTSRSVMLAVDAELAGLPWQALLPPRWRTDLVVSLVPSFTWAGQLYAREKAYPSGPKMLLAGREELIRASDSSRDATKFINLRRMIEKDESRMREMNSLAVVLGHGHWDTEKKTTLIAAEGHTIPIVNQGNNSWLELGQFRILVVHACFGGYVKKAHLGDLGGLPGVTLGSGCRLHCAPVTRIASEAAGTLHRHLMDDKRYPTFGERYLQAIKEDQRVALYTIFGFSDELLT